MYTRAILGATRRVAAQQSVRNTANQVESGFIPGAVRGPMLAATPFVIFNLVFIQIYNDTCGVKPSGVSYTQF